LLAGGRQIAVLRNDGTGTAFPDVVSTSVDEVDFLDVVRAALLDVDADGVMDVLGTSSDGFEPALQPLHNDGAGAFAAMSPALSKEAFGACLVRDVAPLAATSEAQDGVAVLGGPCSESNPLADFPVLIVRGTPDADVIYQEGPNTGTDPQALGSGDVDGDGIDDLVVWNHGDATFTLSFGQDAGTFAPDVLLSEEALCPGCPCPGCGPVVTVPRLFTPDLDGDGRADLLLAHKHVWLGMNLAEQPVGYWLDIQPVLVGDFNEDGVDDLVTFDGQVSRMLLSTP
jgi:hypothetical protein